MDAAWPRACGRRTARPAACLAVWWCRGVGRSAAASPTPTCCSPVACSRIARPWSRYPPSSYRSWTRGTPSGFVAPAVTTRWPMRSLSRMSAWCRYSTGRRSTLWPLYRFPPFGFFAACITAAAMGNARAAIRRFRRTRLRQERGGGVEPHACRAVHHPGGGRRGRIGTGGGAGGLLPGH